MGRFDEEGWTRGRAGPVGAGATKEHSRIEGDSPIDFWGEFSAATTHLLAEVCRVMIWGCRESSKERCWKRLW